MKHRQPGRRWDKTKWRFGLATGEDAQGTIRVPHGLIVDHVQIPEFCFDPKQDFCFEIAPLVHGPLDALLLQLLLRADAVAVTVRRGWDVVGLLLGQLIKEALAAAGGTGSLATLDLNTKHVKGPASDAYSCQLP